MTQLWATVLDLRQLSGQ